MFMQEGLGREGAREEVEGWGWSLRMEALESLKCSSSVHSEDFKLGWREEEGRQAAEKFRCRIA